MATVKLCFWIRKQKQKFDFAFSAENTNQKFFFAKLQLKIKVKNGIELNMIHEFSFSLCRIIN